MEIFFFFQVIVIQLYVIYLNKDDIFDNESMLRHVDKGRLIIDLRIFQITRLIFEKSGLLLHLPYTHTLQHFLIHHA